MLSTTPPIMPAAPWVAAMSMPHRAEQAESPKQMPAQIDDDTSGASSRLRYKISLSTPASSHGARVRAVHSHLMDAPLRAPKSRIDKKSDLIVTACMCARIACQHEKESQKQADEDDKLVPTRALHCRQADANGAQYARQACAPIRFAHPV